MADGTVSRTVEEDLTKVKRQGHTGKGGSSAAGDLQDLDLDDPNEMSMYSQAPPLSQQIDYESEKATFFMPETFDNVDVQSMT